MAGWEKGGGGHPEKKREDPIAARERNEVKGRQIQGGVGGGG